MIYMLIKLLKWSVSLNLASLILEEVLIKLELYNPLEKLGGALIIVQFAAL